MTAPRWPQASERRLITLTWPGPFAPGEIVLTWRASIRCMIDGPMRVPHVAPIERIMIGNVTLPAFGDLIVAEIGDLITVVLRCRGFADRTAEITVKEVAR